MGPCLGLCQSDALIWDFEFETNDTKEQGQWRFLAGVSDSSIQLAGTAVSVLPAAGPGIEYQG